MREIEVKILRGAETDNRRYQTYTVAVEEDAAVSVMNLLEEIYNKQDHSLAFFSHAGMPPGGMRKMHGKSGRRGEAGL